MKSKLLMTSMSTILGLYGILIFFLLIVFNIIGLPLSYLLIGSIIMLVIQFLLAPFFMDLTMRWFYKVKFDYELPTYLVEFIEKVCADNDMKYPKIGFIDDGAPNAFTYGRTKNDARIVLTRGILELLSEDEVMTVVGHEIGHAIHYDMFLMTAVQIVPLVLYYIYDVLTNSSNNSDSGKIGQLFAIIGMVAYILYIISEYVILWFSRTREYYADEFAVMATRNPNALANALVKIGYGLTTANKNNNETDKNGKLVKQNKSHLSSISALGIFDTKSSKSLVVSSYDDGYISKENIKKAARWELWNPWAVWYELNSTHPLISKRIKAISSYSSQYYQSSYITFDEEAPESYVDDFLLELFIKFLPSLIFIIFIITTIVIIAMEIDLNYLLFLGSTIIAWAVSLFIGYFRSHKNKDYKNMKVVDLLSEVKVSGVTSVPCTIEGEIIGKGNPGYIFSEDFVIKDDSGIIFVDYNQPLAIFNFFFALLKSNKYINKQVTIKGWYRRSPVPYIEIHSITMDGKTKTCFTYGFTIVMISLLALSGLFILLVA